MAIFGKGKRGPGIPTGILDVTASMQGSLSFQEPVNLRINGRFEGTLETKGDLTIGPNAVVQADVTGESITVAGRVTGKLMAKVSLKCIPPAVVKGELKAPILEVQPGARLEGTIHVGEEEVRMSLKEVAEYLEVEARLVEQWAREGKIPVVREGDQWRFEKAKIEEWIAAQKSS